MRVIKDNSLYTVTPRPGVTITGTFKIDPTAKPKTMDSTATNGDNAGKTMLGIYELDGDTLKICWAPPGKDRGRPISRAAEGSWACCCPRRRRVELNRRRDSVRLPRWPSG